VSEASSVPTAASPPAPARTGDHPTTAASWITTSHTDRFVEILEELKVSLLISTYQAGTVAVLRARGGELFITYHNFRRPMGIAVSPEQIAIGTNEQIWFLPSAPHIARSIKSGGPYDACYLVRGSHFTGEIHGHEMEWSGRELWVVNTLFSCLCTIEWGHSFVPRWKPRFIGALAAEDRCHLNGLALAGGRPRYLTCLGETDTERGWKPQWSTGGCLIDVPTGQPVLRNLSLPHSPRIQDGMIWFLESGRGILVTVDPQNGSLQTRAELPGYPRGLCFEGKYAFVGLSRLRETSNIEGLAIASDPDTLKCGVAVVDLSSGQIAATFWFTSIIQEIFDIRVDRSCRFPFFSGPDARVDGTPPIWVIPPPRFDLLSR
jgi:uncharacterized protein (TIGR03032 family)